MYRPILIILVLVISLPIHAATLKIATLAPDGTSWMKAMRAGAEEVKERTEGRVKIRFYPGGVMGNDNSVLRKIRVGQLQGGALSGGGLASVYLDIQIYSLPFKFRSYDEIDAVRKEMDPVLKTNLEKAGFISFGISEGGFAYLMSNRPVSRVEELKDQKVWIPEGDRISLTSFESFGISPIPLPLTDVLTGLQTELIDTVASSPIAAIALQWHTRVKYLTDTPLIYVYGTLVIQKRAFNRLAKKDQTIVREVMEKVFLQLNAQNRKDNESARQALLAQGIQFTHPTAEDLTHWRERVEQTLKQLSTEGVYSPEMLEMLERNLKHYRNSGIE